VGLTPARLPAAVAAFALLAAACSGTVAPSSTTTASPTAPSSASTASSAPQPSAESSIMLLSGVAPVESAQSFDDPGFHKVVSIGGTIPGLDGVTGSSGSTIIISLWDASRPDQNCNQDHPLSGCLTIDWSDAPGRPHVPDSGVFDNQVTFASADGTVALYLTDSGALSAVPDQFTPG